MLEEPDFPIPSSLPHLLYRPYRNCVIRNKNLRFIFAAKKASGKSREEVQEEKKKELEKKLQEVHNKLGSSAKKPKGGKSFLHFKKDNMIECVSGLSSVYSQMHILLASSVF